jgi:hypothetical protein
MSESKKRKRAKNERETGRYNPKKCRTRERLKASGLLTGVRAKSSHINAMRSASVYGAEAKFAKGKRETVVSFSRE